MNESVTWLILNEQARGINTNMCVAPTHLFVMSVGRRPLGARQPAQVCRYEYLTSFTDHRPLALMQNRRYGSDGHVVHLKWDSASKTAGGTDGKPLPQARRAEHRAPRQGMGVCVGLSYTLKGAWYTLPPSLHTHIAIWQEKEREETLD